MPAWTARPGPAVVVAAAPAVRGPRAPPAQAALRDRWGGAVASGELARAGRLPARPARPGGRGGATGGGGGAAGTTGGRGGTGGGGGWEARRVQLAGAAARGCGRRRGCRYDGRRRRGRCGRRERRTRRRGGWRRWGRAGLQRHDRRCLSGRLHAMHRELRDGSGHRLQAGKRDALHAPQPMRERQLRRQRLLQQRLFGRVATPAPRGHARSSPPAVSARRAARPIAATAARPAAPLLAPATPRASPAITATAPAEAKKADGGTCTVANECQNGQVRRRLLLQRRLRRGVRRLQSVAARSGCARRRLRARTPSRVGAASTAATAPARPARPAARATHTACRAPPARAAPARPAIPPARRARPAPRRAAAAAPA